MKHESDLKPKKSFEIENIEDNLCEVVFFDLESIEEETRIDEDGNEKVVYKFYTYRQKMNYNPNLKSYVEANYDKLLAKLKKLDYDTLAEEIRTRRNKLLQESDKEMAFDRLGFEIPENITMTNILNVIKGFFDTLANIKGNKWAEYRQKLRDITEQEGFPYNVEFPEKPKE